MTKKILFIGGAPKCATSTLVDLLGQTLAFNVSSPKETFYYVDQDYPLIREYNYFNYGHDGFLKFFLDVKWDTRPLLEGTTHLLYQKKAPELLNKLDCKVVFVLRQPADRIRSSFEYTMNNIGNFNENITFAEYVDLLLSNQKSQIAEKMRFTTSQWVLTNEIYLSNYAPHIKRWKHILGESRVLVLSFDEFKKDPKQYLKQILDFAGIQSSINLNNMVIQRKNQSLSIKNMALHREMVKLNSIIPNNRFTSIVKEIYLFFQKEKKSWGDLNEEALIKLEKYFKNNHPNLKEIINQNNKWKK